VRVDIIDLLSRGLFVAVVINELIAVRSLPKDQQDKIVMPSPVWLTALTLLLPFVIRIPLPTWLAVFAVGCQAVALIIHLLAQNQLIRAKSFAVVTDAGTQAQTKGMYRYLENPIYVGLMLHMFGWAIFMPIGFIGWVLLGRAFRKDVYAERLHLMTKLGTVHSGLDSPFWGGRPTMPAPVMQGKWMMEVEEREPASEPKGPVEVP
jgi:protein-S-isoprenylcysteine O-methyltransferase Ste14